jgi:hypothetical protein
LNLNDDPLPDQPLPFMAKLDQLLAINAQNLANTMNHTVDLKTANEITRLVGKQADIVKCGRHRKKK